ncbi:MAG: InlB B-repeat-containing protein [Candidatus Borkfalkiaceae bacterium]|nr:InlB B-repeat-containing protein [Christensenellaceae bacterium]
MTSIRKTLLSAIIALMTVCSLLFGITLINSNVTARADEELTAADFAVAIAVRVKDDEHPNGGIRFKVRVEKSKFETLMTDGVLKGVKTGVLVTSNAIAKTLDGGLVIENKEVTGVHDLDTTEYWKAIKENEVDYYESVIAIYNVPTDKSNVKLAVMPYVVNGEETIYRNEAGVASMADAVLADKENGDDFVETYIHNYTITYYDKDGNAIDGGSEEKRYGDTIAEAKVTAPEVTGYTFDAWKNAAGTTAWRFGENGTKVTGDTKLYANYTINTYGVTFNSNGGSEVASQTVDYNATATEPSAPTRAGYTFAGWKLGGEDYDFDTPVTTDIALDAVWTATTYYATFKADGETVDAVAYTVETESITEPAVPTKEGYTGAWETYNLTTVGGITVNAVYTAIEYTATINRVSGSTEYVTFTIEDRAAKLASISLTANDAEWTYSWEEALPNELALNNTQEFTETRTKNTYTVTWKNDNGDTLETDTGVEYGATPGYDGSTPTKAADAQYTYTFNEWSPAVSSVTGDATYTATYSSTVNTYTVTWKNGEDVLETDLAVPYGTMPTYDNTDPEKASDEYYDYTFGGWDPALAAVTGNVTYTAAFNREVLASLRNNVYTLSELGMADGSIGSWTGKEVTLKNHMQGTIIFKRSNSSAGSQVNYMKLFGYTWTFAINSYIVTWGDGTDSAIENIQPSTDYYYVISYKVAEDYSKISVGLRIEDVSTGAVIGNVSHDYTAGLEDKTIQQQVESNKIFRMEGGQVSITYSSVWSEIDPVELTKIKAFGTNTEKLSSFTRPYQLIMKAFDEFYTATEIGFTDGAVIGNGGSWNGVTGTFENEMSGAIVFKFTKTAGGGNYTWMTLFHRTGTANSGDGFVQTYTNATLGMETDVPYIVKISYQVANDYSKVTVRYIVINDNTGTVLSDTTKEFTSITGSTDSIEDWVKGHKEFRVFTGGNRYVIKDL